MDSREFHANLKVAKKSKGAADSACPDHAPAPQEVLRFVLPLPNHGLLWGWLGILNLPSNYEVDCTYKVMRLFLEESTWCSKNDIWVWVNTEVQSGTTDNRIGHTVPNHPFWGIDDFDQVKEFQ